MGSQRTRSSFNLNLGPSTDHVTAASVSLAAEHKPCCRAGKPHRGGGTGAGEDRALQRWDAKRDEACFAVCTLSQRDLGLLHLKCRMCDPDLAVPQAKIQIKSSSAPCPGQSWRGSACAPRPSEGAQRLFKGWFSTTTDTERHSTVQPGTSAQPCTSRTRPPSPPPGQGTRPSPGRRGICRQRCWGGGSPSAGARPSLLHSVGQGEKPISLLSSVGYGNLICPGLHAGRAGCINRKDVFTGCIVPGTGRSGAQ